jgi:hypothetical protein
MKILILALIPLSFSACGLLWSNAPSEKTVIIEQYVNDLEREPVPGTVHGPWAETMVQDIEVPGTIDSKQVYYRMPHRAIVEIRHEKYQRAQYPDADKIYRERE